MLAPLCTRMERKGFSPSASAAICVLGLVLLTATALSAFIPYLFAHTMDLIRRIMPTLSTLESAVRCFFECPWTASYRTNQFERMARHADFSRDRNHRQRKHGIRCQSRSICFFIRHRVLSAMRKKTIGQAFAFAASHCAAGGFFICLFGLQKRVDELPVRRAENQLIRLSGNIRRAFRAWNQ